mmetsp:Transcript_137593/g.294126  ORF Transcript_137593/g.294126 Transcript_137593/m.294126 type:complete len:200 (+) Transcript_137593:431-1030(+)
MRCRSSSAFFLSSSALRCLSSARASNSSRALRSCCSCAKRCASSSRRNLSSSLSCPCRDLSAAASFGFPFLSSRVCCSFPFSTGTSPGCPVLFRWPPDDSQLSAARATAAYQPSPRSLACRSTTPVSAPPLPAPFLDEADAGGGLLPFSLWRCRPRLRLRLRERERSLSLDKAAICFCASSTSARQGVIGGGALFSRTI